MTDATLLECGEPVWLVTGGAGFIGAHVVRAMRTSGLSVLVLDSLETGIRERLPNDVPVLHGRTRDVARLTAGLDLQNLLGVIHLAAWKNARESRLYPLKYWENNVVDFLALLDWISHLKVPNLILSSSSSIYGNQAGVTEESAPMPISPYGHTKLACELSQSDLMAASGLRGCCLRYFNVIGCDAFNNAHDRGVDNIVPRFVQAAVSGLPIEIYGDGFPTPDGTCLRDYIDVRDVARAHVLVAQALSSGVSLPRIVNVGSGVPTSVRAIAHYVAECFPGGVLDTRIRSADPADPAEVWATESLRLRSLGWRPRFDVRASIGAHVRAVISEGTESE